MQEASARGKSVRAGGKGATNLDPLRSLSCTGERRVSQKHSRAERGVVPARAFAAAGRVPTGAAARRRLDPTGGMRRKTRNGEFYRDDGVGDHVL